MVDNMENKDIKATGARNLIKVVLYSSKLIKNKV